MQLAIPNKECKLVPAALQTVDMCASLSPSKWIVKYSKIWPNILAQLKVRHSISEILHHEFKEVYVLYFLKLYIILRVCHQKKLLVRRKTDIYYNNNYLLLLLLLLLASELQFTSLVYTPGIEVPAGSYVVGVSATKGHA